MDIQFSKKVVAKKGVIIVPVFSDKVEEVLAKNSGVVADFVSGRMQYDEFKGEKGEMHVGCVSEKSFPSKIVVVGLGDSESFGANEARHVGAKIAKKAICLKQREVSVILDKTFIPYLQEFFEGYLFSQYQCLLYKTSNKAKKTDNYSSEKLTVIIDVTKFTELESTLKKTLLIAEAMDYVRDLVNGPANVIDGAYLTREAELIAKKNGYRKALLGFKELAKIKAGGILSVNQGCEKEPRLLVLQYDGGKRKEKPIVLIGKGVIFDTGGYNLKSHGNIETMNQDMSGGATILAIMKIIKRLGIKKNIVGIVPVVENLINENAYRPSDIITMMSGNTVEITNTDAEGRLVLADAIHYSLALDPEMIVTIATLTGASLAAVGHRYCAIMGNDDDLRLQMQQAGDKVDDLAWPLPIHEDYRKEMDSRIADFRNFDLGSGGGAGSSKGAAFLEKFVGKNKWCHIDIGGTAFTTRPKPYESKGSTAHGLRMLLKFLES